MSRKKIPISELDLETIGGRIAFLRIKNNLTQYQLSEKTGISRGNISGLESNKFDPSVKAISKLVELFSITADWIIFGKNSGSPNEIGSESLLEYKTLFSKFSNPKTAEEMFNNLLELESIDIDGFEEIQRIVEMKIERKQASINKPSKKRKKIS